MSHLIILRDIEAEVWNWDPANDHGEAFWHVFHAGESYEVGEVSPCPDGTTALELDGLGVTELPNDAFCIHEPIRFTFNPLVTFPN